jgi:hypothetical protein
MNKRGLSAIISTILLVLLGIAALIVIWGFLSPFLANAQNRVDVSSNLLGVSFEVKALTATVDNNFSFVLERDIGGGNVTGVQISFQDDKGRSVVYSGYNDTVFNPYEAKRIAVNCTAPGPSYTPANGLVGGKLTKIVVVPMTRDSRGAISQGNPITVYNK